MSMSHSTQPRPSRESVKEGIAGLVKAYKAEKAGEDLDAIGKFLEAQEQKRIAERRKEQTDPDQKA